MKKIMTAFLVMSVLVFTAACSSKSAKENVNPKTETKKVQEDTLSDNTEFSLNPEFLSLYGKEKSFVDEKCGNKGVYYAEFGLVDYENGLMVGYNCIGTDMIPKASDKASSLQIKLDKLFFNCPFDVTVEQINSVFGETFNSYNEMDMENVLVANYKGMSICFYPDMGLGKDSYASLSADEFIAPVESDNSSLYYDYAIEHDGEFWEINQNWRDDKNYYYLADVDHDNQKEMVVKIGCGVEVYKEVNGKVEQIFRDRLMESSGSVHYWVAQFNGRDYIVYTSASSSEYMTLNVVKDGALSEFRKSIIIGTDSEKYEIDGKSVFKSQYQKYKESVKFTDGITLDGLK